MPRTVDCPVAYFAGSVTLPDFPNYMVLAEWQRAARRSMALLVNTGTDDEPKYAYAPDTVDADFRALRIPVILMWVEKWELQHVPAKPTYETFPAAPRKKAAALYDWLVNMLSEEIDGETDGDPNA